MSTNNAAKKVETKEAKPTNIVIFYHGELPEEVRANLPENDIVIENDAYAVSGHHVPVIMRNFLQGMLETGASFNVQQRGDDDAVSIKPVLS